MRTFRRCSVLTVLAVAALVSTGGAASADAGEFIPPPVTGPCTVHDAPTVTAAPPYSYSVNLHTEVECFRTPVSVG